MGSPGGIAAAAIAAGFDEKTVVHWFSGKTSPKLVDIEQLAGALGFVTVLVPYQRAPFGAHIRDLLTGMDRSVYDAQSTDTNEVLDDNLRLLQVELIALKRQHLAGAIDDGNYRTRFDRLQSSLLATVDTLARARIAGSASGELADEVEFVYGSARGPGYREFNEKIERAAKARAAMAAAQQKQAKPELPAATAPSKQDSGKE